MSATAVAPRPTPTTSGMRVAQDMLLSGLTSFNRIAEKAAESDIVRWRSGPSCAPPAAGAFTIT